jgi:hypothetical protein
MGQPKLDGCRFQSIHIDDKMRLRTNTHIILEDSV